MTVQDSLQSIAGTLQEANKALESAMERVMGPAADIAGQCPRQGGIFGLIDDLQALACDNRQLAHRLAEKL